MCEFFFFNDTATTEIYTLSLHDALPIFGVVLAELAADVGHVGKGVCFGRGAEDNKARRREIGRAHV